MATIDELAGRPAPAPQSTSISNAQTVRSAQYRVGDSLANDLAGILKPLSRTVQTQNQLSTRAAQRVAVDKKTDLAMFMTEQDNLITAGTTSSELRDIQLRKQAYFAENANTQFDNEDAQNAFDDMYTRDGGVAVAQSNAKLEVAALTQDAKVNRETNKVSIAAQARQKMTMNSKQIAGHVDSITAGGFYTNDQAYMDVADSLNNALNEQYKVSKNLPIYNENGSINMEAQAKSFNQQYGGIATMDETGAVTKVGDATENAVKSAIGNWKTLQSSHVSKKREFNSKLSALKTRAALDNTNLNKGYVPSTEVLAKENDLRGQLDTIITDYDVTEREIDPVTKSLLTMKDTAQISEILEEDVKNLSMDELRVYMTKGKEVPNFYENLTGKTGKRFIGADKYTAIVNHMKETASKNLLAVDITPENASVMERNITKLSEFEELTQSESAFTTKYKNYFAVGTPTNILSSKSLKQSLVFHRQRVSTGNEAYKYDDLMIGRLEEVLTRTVDGEPLTEVQIAKAADNIVKVDKVLRLSKTASVQLDADVREGIMAAEKGDGFLGELFTLEAYMATGTIDAAKWYVSSNRQYQNAKSVVKDLQYTDYGTLILGGKDQRLPIPIDVDESVFKNALHMVRDKYNADNNTNLKEDDVLLEVSYNKDTNNFQTTMRTKKAKGISDVLMGTLDINSAEMLLAKQKQEEKSNGGYHSRRASTR